MSKFGLRPPCSQVLPYSSMEHTSFASIQAPQDCLLLREHIRFVRSNRKSHLVLFSLIALAYLSRIMCPCLFETDTMDVASLPTRATAATADHQVDISIDAYVSFLDEQHAIATTAHKIAPTEFKSLRLLDEQLRPHVRLTHGVTALHCSQYQRTFSRHPLDHLNAAYTARRARKPTGQPQLERRKVATAALGFRDQSAGPATADAGAHDHDAATEALVFERRMFASSSMWEPASAYLMFFDDGRWGLFWKDDCLHYGDVPTLLDALSYVRNLYSSIPCAGVDLQQFAVEKLGKIESMVVVEDGVLVRHQQCTGFKHSSDKTHGEHCSACQDLIANCRRAVSKTEKNSIDCVALKDASNRLIAG